MTRSAMHFTVIAGLVAGLSGCSRGTPADEDRYANRSVDLIVPFAAGGAADLAARAFAEGLSDALGQSIVVVNRDGAAGTIGGGVVAAAAADGYTLGFVPGGVLTSQPHVIDATYDLDAFDYVCQVTERFLIVSGPGDRCDRCAGRSPARLHRNRWISVRPVAL